MGFLIKKEVRPTFGPLHITNYKYEDKHHTVKAIRQLQEGEEIRRYVFNSRDSNLVKIIVDQNGSQSITEYQYLGSHLTALVINGKTFPVKWNNIEISTEKEDIDYVSDRFHSLKGNRRFQKSLLKGGTLSFISWDSKYGETKGCHHDIEVFYNDVSIAWRWINPRNGAKERILYSSFGQSGDIQYLFAQSFDDDFKGGKSIVNGFFEAKRKKSKWITWEYLFGKKHPGSIRYSRNATLYESDIKKIEILNKKM